MNKESNIKSFQGMPVTKIVQAWLDEKKWDDQISIDHDKNTATLKSSFDIKGETCTLYIEVDEKTPSLTIYLYNSLTITVRSLEKAVMTANDINGELDVGRIYASVDAPFQFKHGLIFGKDNLSVELLSIAVQNALDIFGKYQDKLQSSVFTSERLSLENLDDCYEWKEIEGVNKLKKWANKLQHACSNKTTSAHWKIIGNALILINDSYEYCQSVLKTVAKDSKLNYIIIGKDDVVNKVSNYDFTQHSPVLVYLEPGRWKRDKWEGDEEDEEETKMYFDFRAQLKKVLEDFSPENPVIFATSTSDLDGAISNDIKHKGVFDLFISLPKKPFSLTGREFINDLGANVCGPTLSKSHGKVGHLVNSYSPRKRHLTILALHRLHHDEGRKIEYLDLIDADLHSLVEEGRVKIGNREDLLNTAYHEAGHALMAVLEYEGQNIPDYISVLPGASGFAGVTMQSLGFLAKMDASDKTYLNFKRDIRVSLGGRAGEEILVGPERITNGASSDLASATNSAKRAFQYWGFCPAMDTPGKSEANLCVISDPPTSSELQHIEKMVRDFLAQEYKIVRDKLIANKLLLDEVANHLMRDNVVDQDELAEICKKYGISIFKH